MADTPPAQVTPPPTFGTPATPPADAPPTPTAPPAPVEPPKPNDPANPPAEPPKEEPQRIVPERYDLKLPDGSYMDQKSLERVESYAKTNKLTQEEASKFLEQQDQDTRGIMEDRKAAWLEETKSDREIGGANLEANVEKAKVFLDKYMAPELRADLTRTGYGNNRHFMKFVLDMAKRSANDQIVIGGAQGGSPSDRSTADLFYAETTSKGKY